MAAGEATIVKDGVTYAVNRPEIVPLAELIDYFAVSDRRMFPFFGVEQCLRLYRVETAD